LKMKMVLKLMPLNTLKTNLEKIKEMVPSIKKD